jgi:hypothetical protein
MNLTALTRCFALNLALLCVSVFSAKAQTDYDADMMAKNLFCSGFMYSYSSWDHYWEGTLKRTNENIGKVSTEMFAYMGAYGVSKNFNLLFNIPYIKTKATAGTLSGLEGFQDLSLFAKWKAYSKKIGPGTLGIFGVGGYSFPVSDYSPDFLPMSIGLKSKTLLLRAMADYQIGKFFVTGSGSYMFRNNVTLNRDVYYTTEMHLTNEVEMPNANSISLRTGYRTKYLWAEGVITKYTTLGGFDITRNNMPFVSNKMNATTTGVRIKYVPKSFDQLSLLLNGDYVIDGRNVGQSTSIAGSIFYILNFSKKKTPINNIK